MDGSVLECELAERDPGLCVCKGGGPTLDVLNDVHRAYEGRMKVIDKVACSHAQKLQMQVELLRSWVNDLIGQNTLLARVVEELEAEATTRLFIERRRHTEIVCELKEEVSVLRRRLARKDSDMRGLIEVLRRLREFDYFSFEGIHFFEVTESDIFGNMTWLHTLDQGDGKYDTSKMKKHIRRHT